MLAGGTEGGAEKQFIACVQQLGGEEGVLRKEMTTSQEDFPCQKDY